jgi:hypothetical protein
MRLVVVGVVALLAIGCGRQCECTGISPYTVQLHVVDAVSMAPVAQRPALTENGQPFTCDQVQCLQPNYGQDHMCTTWGLGIIGHHSLGIAEAGYVPLTIDVDTGIVHGECCDEPDHHVEMTVQLEPQT